MNTKLHAVADAKGRPIGFYMSAGQISDHTSAAALLGSLPRADWLLADRGYDADRFREALKDKGIKVCIPGRKPRKKAVKYDKRRYKRRNRIEIMFGRLKDWRRVATRYDRCPQTFFFAVILAAIVLFWPGSRTSPEPNGSGGADHSATDNGRQRRKPRKPIGQWLPPANWRQITSASISGG